MVHLLRDHRDVFEAVDAQARPRNGREAEFARESQITMWTDVSFGEHFARAFILRNLVMEQRIDVGMKRGTGSPIYRHIPHVVRGLNFFSSSHV